MVFEISVKSGFYLFLLPAELTLYFHEPLLCLDFAFQARQSNAVAHTLRQKTSTSHCWMHQATDRSFQI